VADVRRQAEEEYSRFKLKFRQTTTIGSVFER